MWLENGDTLIAWKQGHEDWKPLGWGYRSTSKRAVWRQHPNKKHQQWSWAQFPSSITRSMVAVWNFKTKQNQKDLFVWLWVCLFKYYLLSWALLQASSLVEVFLYHGGHKRWACQGGLLWGGQWDVELPELPCLYCRVQHTAWLMRGPSMWGGVALLAYWDVPCQINASFIFHIRNLPCHTLNGRTMIAHEI